MSRPFKYIMTDEARQALIEQYDSSPRTISALSERFGVPRPIIRAWAHRLQISTYHWTELDIQYLKKHVTVKTVDEIAFKLDRTTQAVRKRAELLGLSLKPNNTGWTLTDLMVGLEVSQQVIYRWMRKGWLVGTRQGPASLWWNFTDAALKKFLQEHPEEISEEVINSLWVRDLLFSYEYGMGPLARVR